MHDRDEISLQKQQ